MLIFVLSLTNQGIKMRVHEQRDLYKALYEKQLQGMIELKAYLNSSKFSIDINVNKNDILLRLHELDNDLFIDEIKLNN